MLGMQAAVAAGGERARRDVAHHRPQPDPGRTPGGDAWAVSSSDEPLAAVTASGSVSGSVSGWDGAEAHPSSRRSGSAGRAALWVGVLFLGAVVAVGLVAVGYLAMSSPGGLSAEVVQSDAGEVLELRLATAAAGTRFRFHGEEQPIVDGRARFLLTADHLRVGDNALTVEVLDPDGTTRREHITLTLAYRVRADLVALDRAPPSIDIVVEVPAGSEVTLEGEPLTIDAQGRGVRAFPLAAVDDAGAVDMAVRYAITLPDSREGGGESAEGVVRTRIPFATLQLDRPGAAVVTESAEIEVAGAVHRAARVEIDGESVPVQNGRFVHQVPLPEARSYDIRILAREPGKAPRAHTVVVRRVDDLRAEAEGFEPDPDLDYARIQPNPAIYRGRKIALEGRIYNVTVQSGGSVLQLLVRDCPRGQRCPLWVQYPAASEASVNDWVRVLGTVAGEQQFRSESERVITVPRVDAEYVLPSEPPRR